MRPEPRWIALLAVSMAAGIGGTFWRPLIPPLLAAVAVLFIVAAIDLGRARRLPEIRAKRTVPGALALGAWTTVELVLSTEAEQPLHVKLHDHHPIEGEVSGLPRSIEVSRDAAIIVRYRFRPGERGPWEFGATEVLLRSPWRLWRIRRRLGAHSQVKVYPDFRSVQRYAILAVDNAMSRLGIRRRQRRGEGLELRQLREYRDGDSLRQIDWKATSRRDHIISREYEDERDQKVVFLLDCGWKMRAVDDGEAHFDHALNSILLLTYVAVRQGDAVGLMTFGGNDRWLPPQKGPAGMRSMLEAVYDLDTKSAAPDFTRAATELMVRQRRRALIVVVTNFGDEDAEEAVVAVRLMRRRHLVLLASLREASLGRQLAGPTRNFKAALRTAAIHHFLAARRRAHDRLRGRGVSALDVTPAQLPAAMVNRYLEIKRGGAL